MTLDERSKAFLGMQFFDSRENAKGGGVLGALGAVGYIQELPSSVEPAPPPPPKKKHLCAIIGLKIMECERRPVSNAPAMFF